MISKINALNSVNFKNNKINFGSRKVNNVQEPDSFSSSKTSSKVSPNEIIELETRISRIQLKSILAKIRAQNINQAGKSILDYADKETIALNSLLYDVRLNGFNDFLRNGSIIRVNKEDPSAIIIDETNRKSNISKRVILNPNYNTTQVYKNLEFDEKGNSKASEYFEFDFGNLTNYIRGYEQNDDGNTSAKQAFMFSDNKLIKFDKDLRTRYDRSEQASESIIFKDGNLVRLKKDAKTTPTMIKYQENYLYKDGNFYSYLKGFESHIDQRMKIAEYYYGEDYSPIEYLKGYEESANGAESGILLTKVDGVYKKENLNK